MLAVPCQYVLKNTHVQERIPHWSCPPPLLNLFSPDLKQQVSDKVGLLWYKERMPPWNSTVPRLLLLSLTLSDYEGGQFLEIFVEWKRLDILCCVQNKDGDAQLYLQVSRVLFCALWRCVLSWLQPGHGQDTWCLILRLKSIVIPVLAVRKLRHRVTWSMWAYYKAVECSKVRWGHSCEDGAASS